VAVLPNSVTAIRFRSGLISNWLAKAFRNCFSLSKPDCFKLPELSIIKLRSIRHFGAVVVGEVEPRVVELGVVEKLVVEE
jgi:hypothetical protein